MSCLLLLHTGPKLADNNPFIGNFVIQDLVGRAHVDSSSMVLLWSCSDVSRGCGLGKVPLGWPIQWLTLVNGEWLVLAVVGWALC